MQVDQYCRAEVWHCCVFRCGQDVSTTQLCPSSYAAEKVWSVLAALRMCCTGRLVLEIVLHSALHPVGYSDEEDTQYWACWVKTWGPELSADEERLKGTHR